ncbi:DUF1983 domain-containing protein [Rothia nasimurium]|uniref:Phage tail protein n=1 Tax=Luteibacter anthropi TaxID=564369 RepID=A0A7X5UBB2_9GAMM|nr:phage tail protein [Luteibacter anthropi]NII07270.1 phage tail protein [Luteibacter anthropi]
MGYEHFITGAKGGGSAHTPVEAPDTLRSISYFQVEDALSEGEIGGLVNGLQSVKLDGTPVANADGTLNFTSVSVQQRTGTQDQTYVPGYGDVKNEIGISTELKSATPWVRAVSNRELSAVAITLQVDSIQQSNTKNGDINGYLIAYSIDVQTDGGAWQTVINSAFNGKASAPYQRTHRIDLPAATTGWNVRVRRLTANANSATIADTTRVVSITEIIDAKLRYPNTAYVAISGDASQFSNVPARSYVCWGRIIRVPSNYDPQTRAYTGAWDGTLKPAWTDNPAWVLYDMILNNRFGLGDRIDASLVDKWELYRIAQYCDQLVGDGKGGQEPRFRCSAYLQTRQDGFKLLSDLASIVRGVSYWMGGSLTTVADMPADPVYPYTAANVIGGRFTYQSSARKTRCSAALVTWNDPANSYKQAVEYVEDTAAIARYGLQQVELVAMGCTSQGQAHRAGLWAITTSQVETDSVTFAVGLDGLRAAPGQIITVQDPNRSGARQGGRLSAATAGMVTVDRSPDQVAVGDTLTVVRPTGLSETRTISRIDGRDLYVSQGFTEIPVAQSVWSVESGTLALQTFRVLSVTEDTSGDKIQFTISAIQHNASKFAHIDDGAQIQIPPISKLPVGTQVPPTNVRISSHQVVEQGIANNVMTIEWTAAAGAALYKVEWQKDSGQWIQAGTVATTSVDVVGIYTGTYVARVTAFNNGNTPSLAALSQPTAVTGKTGSPPALVSLKATALPFGIALDWAFPEGASDTQRTEIFASTSAVRPDVAGTLAYKMGDYAYPGDHTELHGLAAGASLFFWGRIVDKAGNVGPFYPPTGAVNGQSVTDPDALQDYWRNTIGRGALQKELMTEIDAANGVAGQVQQQAKDIVKNAQDIAKEILDRQSADQGLGSFITTVSQKADDTAAQVSRLTTRTGDAENNIVTLQRTTGEQATQLSQLGTMVGQHTASITNLQQTQANQANQISELQVSSAPPVKAGADSTKAGANVRKAGIYTYSVARVDGDLAQAIKTEQLTAQVGAYSAQIQTIQQAQATLDGKVSASVVTKVGVTSDGKYYQAGFGLGIDNSGGTVQSQFLVTVDTFAIIGSSAGGSTTYPFVFQGGQLFLSQALIGKGWITDAMIGNSIQATAVDSLGRPIWELNKTTGFVQRSADATGSSELTAKSLNFYDPNGTLRVRLGRWT